MTVKSDRAATHEVPDSRTSVAQHETIAPPNSLYIPSLDGMRAISVLLVFFSHAGLGSTVVPGGFGVTIFFLLSGFLITTLLRMEFSRYQHINLRDFYLRRVLRILPPLYVSMTLAIVLFLIETDYAAIPLGGTIAQALQVSNYYLIFASPGVILPGTGVFWSLAIEEHFYLLFPLLYVWMCPRLSVSRQITILLILCAAALVWRCILHFHFEAGFLRTYYGTDTRYDSILLGCVFAIVANPVLRDPLHGWFLRHMKWLLPLAIVVVLATFLIRDDGFRETLRYTVQGLALVPLFIAAIHYQESWPVRFLNLPFMRFLGVLSYTLYLCHGIIMDFVNHIWHAHAVLTGAASLAAAIGFAALVHYWIERPCTKIRKRLSRVLKA